MSQVYKKAKRWITKKKDGHDLMEAPYEIKDMGPFDNDLSGAPIPQWYIASILLTAIGMGAWVYYFFISDPRNLGVELATLGYYAGWAGLILFGMLSGFVGIQLWMGIAGKYQYFLNMTIWDAGLEEVKRPEWRVKKVMPLWNPKTKQGAWREVSDHENMLEKEEMKTEKKQLKQEIKELKEQQKQEQIDQMAVAIDEKMEKAGKRFTSAREIIKAARVVAQAVEEEKELDVVQDMMDYRKQLIRLIEAIDIDYYVTLLHVEGDMYPLILSKYPLFGGDIHSGISEFATHEMGIRSWMLWASRKVNKACVGAGIKMDDYTFKIIPGDEEMLIDKEEAEMRWSPIIYVTQSDGSVKDIVQQYKQSPTVPTQSDVLQTELIYDASTSDKLLKKMKLLTSHVETGNMSEEEIKRFYESWKKKQVARGSKLMRQTGETGEEGIVSRIRGTSWGSALKWIAYMFGMAMVVVGLLAVLNSMGYVSIDWLTPGNQTSDEWTVGSLMLSWLKLKLGGFP